jgi:hypothetical protein
VLEAERKVVGYLGNISFLYHYGDRTLTAVAGRGFAVDTAYRAASFCLVAAFHRQKSIDLYLTTTASEMTGKIVRAFKSDPLCQADYGTLVWVLRPYPLARAVFKDLGIGPRTARIAGVLASAAIGADKILRRRWPRQTPKIVAAKEIKVSDIGDDFQALWMEKLRESPRLLFADRSPAALRWHFGSSREANVRLLCCYSDGELLGYAAVRKEQNRANGLQTTIVADMLAKQDDPGVVRSLWAAAYENAKREGSHILRVIGFPHAIRRLCLQWRPYLDIEAVHPFYYRAAEPILHKTLSDGLTWYATAFDGDRTLS